MLEKGADITLTEEDEKEIEKMMNDQNLPPVRTYFMREDMKKYTIDLDTFCGNREKVAELAAKIEKMMEADGLTCEEALLLPAFLYMRMEMTLREELNTRKYRSMFTNETL